MFIERTSVGLDVHARSVRAAVIDSFTGEVIEQAVPAQVEQVVEFVLRIRQEHGEVVVTYEAGPSGYVLYRALEQVGVRCQVAAPSKLLRPPGDRVKTDARDAMLLARLARNDDIVCVQVPTVAQEAARDLVRAREDARRDLMAARHRLSKLCLRQGQVYTGGDAWTGKHDAWLRRIRAQDLATACGPGTLTAFDAAYDTVQVTLARRDRLESAIMAAVADGDEFTDVTRRLGCLRGIATLTGYALAVEIGDWHRFTGATIGAFLGLVPSEHSSGASRAQGSITKTGNSHARRLLIEAAWQHKKPYRPGATMTARWRQAPATTAARGDLGNRRLHRRWIGFEARKKPNNLANTAIARELAGWCWSLATMD